jgi:hypothetical protein
MRNTHTSAIFFAKPARLEMRFVYNRICIKLNKIIYAKSIDNFNTDFKPARSEATWSMTVSVSEIATKKRSYFRHRYYIII